MEALVIIALAFVLAPLPICIYLLVQRKRLLERVEALERSKSVEARTPETSKSPVSTIYAQAQKTEPTPKNEEPPRTPFTPKPETIARPLLKPATIAKKSIPAPTSTRAHNSTRPSTPSKSKRSIAHFLRSIGLLPPDDLERSEAGIIQWWALRIGGLLAVLTVIFAAAYISKNTSPLVRFFELIAADAAVIGLGAYFWNKRRSFASILITVGLSMLYVTMAAGYALAPVRVFTNPIIGIAFQFATIIGIYLTSIRLKERSIAFIATLFGFASSIFSAYVGLNEGALISAIALQFAGIAFGHRWRFSALISLSALSVYLPVLTFCGLAIIDSQSFTVPYLQSVIGFLAIAVSTLPFITLRTKIADLFSTRAWQLIVIANTSLCCAFGYAYVKSVNGDLLWLYGTLSILFLAWAALFSRKGLNTLLFQLFFLKGCGLGALWLVNYFTGEIRWFALLIECVLIAWSTRQSKSNWSEAAGVLLWLTAANMAANAPAELMAWGLPWILYSLFPILSVTAATFQLQVLDSNKLRKTCYCIFGVITGLISCTVIDYSTVGDTQIPIYFIGFAIVFAGLSRLPQLSTLPLLLAAAPPLLGSHFAFWNAPESIATFIVVIATSLAFAYAAAVTIGKAIPKRRNLPEFVLISLSAISIYAYCMSEYSSAAWFPYFAPIFAIALKSMRRPPLKTLSDAYILPILLDLVFFTHHAQSLTTRITCLAIYSLLLAAPILIPAWERNLQFLRTKRIGQKTAHILVALLLLVGTRSELSWLASTLITLGGACMFFILWRLHRHRIALVVSTILSGITLVIVANQYLNYGEYSPWSWQILLVGGGLTLAVLIFGGTLSLRPSRRLTPTVKTALIYGAAIISYLSIAFSFAYAGLSLDSYYTPAIATYGLVLIGLGIGLKIKAYRMIALVGFLLPLGRLFIFDIQETLHRIIAFAALAILLTTIGYLYSRYASRIE